MKMGHATAWAIMGIPLPLLENLHQSDWPDQTITDELSVAKYYWKSAYLELLQHSSQARSLRRKRSPKL